MPPAFSEELDKIIIKQDQRVQDNFNTCPEVVRNSMSLFTFNSSAVVDPEGDAFTIEIEAEDLPCKCVSFSIVENKFVMEVRKHLMAKRDFGRYGVKITLKDDSDSGEQNEILIELMVDYIGRDGQELIAESEAPKSLFDGLSFAASGEVESVN